MLNLARKTGVVAWTLLSTSVAFSQELVDQESGEVTRVRNLFLQTRDSTLAQRVVDTAFNEFTVRLIRRVKTVESEDVLLGQMMNGQNQFLPAPARERLFLETARRLGAIGSRTALPLLEEMARREPSLVAFVGGCRGRDPVVVFDYPQAAEWARSRILFRAYRQEFTELPVQHQVEWLLQAATDPSRERLSMALEGVRALPSALRRHVREELLGGATPLTEAGSQIVVEALVRDGALPEERDLRRLSLPATHRLLRMSEHDPQYYEAIIAIARSHSGLVSLAAALGGQQGVVDTRGYLERDGATAAAVLARDDSTVLTRRLEAILLDDGASESLLRHTALALMHQGTTEARHVLERTLERGSLPTSISRKLERWLRP